MESGLLFPCLDSITPMGIDVIYISVNFQLGKNQFFPFQNKEICFTIIKSYADLKHGSNQYALQT